MFNNIMETMGWKTKFGTWDKNEIMVDITIIIFFTLIITGAMLTKGWI